MSKLALATPATMDGLERVLIEGDLKGLSQEQRVLYYTRVCESVGLNPLTQPFEYLNLNGKTILYARRACTDQLRKIHNVSVTVVSREVEGGIYVVTARAVLLDGRCDESIGAVPIDGLKGENLANALMKSETKAKRRVTLAICGLSMMDELEVASIPSAPKPASRSLDDVAFDRETGEVKPHTATPTAVTLDEYGLPIPASPCPVVRPGKENAGKRWDELPGWLITKMYTADADRMTPAQREWAEYLIAKRAARKAAESTVSAEEAAEIARAEAAEGGV